MSDKKPKGSKQNSHNQLRSHLSDKKTKGAKQNSHNQIRSHMSDNKTKGPKQNRDMVFYAPFNNISVILGRSVLLVEETGVPGETHRPVASHWPNG